jgi:hypothetical protein
VSQLGAGFGSDYPSTIDSRQVFQNVVNAAPDSDTRLDAELANDSLDAIVQIETTLGAGVQGAFASLAARLAALESGSATPLTNVVPFSSATNVLVPGSAHQQGQQALFFAVYDASTPRRLFAPGTFSVYPTSFNANVTFEVPESGIVLVAKLEPQFISSFTTPASPPYTVTIPGGVHGLGETYLFYQVYDTALPANVFELGSFSVNTTTFDVTMTFATQQTGTVVLAVGSPRYVLSFTDITSLTIPGTTHGLATPNLLSQLYAPSGANPVAIAPGGLTIHATTFDVTLTFAGPQSGVIVLTPAPTVIAQPALLDYTPAPGVPPPTRTTLAVQEQQSMTQLQTSVERLTARLATLETAYGALLAQVSTASVEEPTP